MPSAVNYIKNGRLRGIAVTTAQRSPATPDLPTIAEACINGYEAGSWYGFAAPGSGAMRAS